MGSGRWARGLCLFAEDTDLPPLAPSRREVSLLLPTSPAGPLPSPQPRSGRGEASAFSSAQSSTPRSGCSRGSAAAPVLEQAGFGVLVPSRWRSPGSRLGVRLKARSKRAAAAASSGLHGLAGICAYRLQVALGDRTLSAAELARLKQPLARVADQWVELHEQDLAAANHVIHFDRWWDPAVEDRTTDRSFRIGQRRDVQVRKLVCVGTLDERIDQMIEQKRALAERIVGSGESGLTEPSTAELREILTLSADVVAEG